MTNLVKSLMRLAPVALWTVGYAFAVWVIMWWLFHFDVFSSGAWTRITSIELHGFAGLVFFVLVLAAVPLYIATTVVMMRTKSVPIKLPMPKCFEPVPKKKAEAESAPAEPEVEPIPKLPAGMPMEMRENFARVRKSAGMRQHSVFNRPTDSAKQNEMVSEPVVVPVAPVATDVAIKKTVAAPVSENSAGYSDNGDAGLPLPADFDVGAGGSDFGVPVFADIDFDSDTESEKKTSTDVQHDDLADVLNKHKLKATRRGDLVQCGDFIIAEHNDDSFWVADEIDWFAAGKQKPSPIKELIKVRDSDGLRPVMYLATNNIMDLDKVAIDWKDKGITVVDSIEKLLKLVGE